MLENLFVEILGALIVFLFAWFWAKGILPAFNDMVYSGVRINGRWEIKQAQFTVEGERLSVIREIFMDLDQKANTITGSAHSTYKTNGEITDYLTYSVSGEVKDRFVSLYFKINQQHRIAYSTFLLEIVADGNELAGYRSFYGFKKKTIMAVKCTCERVK